MSETLMTEANQTNEGDTQQPVDASTEATTDTQQQAESVQEQQVSDETAVEDETSESETLEGAPETYEFNTKISDDSSELDPEVVTAFGEVAKELDLPQDAAQKVLDKVAPVIQAKQAKVLEQVKTDSANDSQADKEFGGENLAENLEIAKSRYERDPNLGPISISVTPPSRPNKAMMEDYAAIGVDRYIPIMASSDETTSLKYLENLNSELF